MNKNNRKDIKKMISMAKSEDWKVCLYGIGKIGRNYGYSLLEYVDLKPNYVCDADKDVLDSFTGDVIKISLEEILCIKEDILVFVCLGVKYVKEACTNLERNKYLHIIDLDSYISEDMVINKFYGFDLQKRIETNPKIAVYTCITGGYDDLIEPKFISDNCDYYCISDRKGNDTSIYRYLDVDEIRNIHLLANKEKNRYCKTHGNVIFKEYDYSIYIDGSIEIIGDISSYINCCNGTTGLAILKHPWRDCIYEEGIRISLRNIVDNRALNNLFKEYYKEGMPLHYGLFECSIIVSHHKNELGNKILELWYQEYMRHKLRDQFSLPYVLWKNGISSDSIGWVDDGRDVRESSIAKKVVTH
ncbi:glycosyltransferase domain-containing protein [Butyrivibrio sp. WCE2006]|uniref:glycosyltransferase domain-containing protein n=1 Tax=Butyrivibrio sp. WCE2006 TaxID=1410611 RepID=UPI0005D2C9B5|nr:glycosyltransferase domain-containing protein [Butyrivibrio sp. WCE2006]